MLDRLLSMIGYERRDASFTDTLVSVLLSRASGNAVSASQLAALETAAGAVGRAFASARIEGRHSEAITPDIAQIIGRELIKRGECLLLIEPGGPDALRLVPVGDYSIAGSYAPESWRYDLTLQGPTASHTRTAASADVVHCRINCDPARPWEGNAPTSLAALTASLAAETQGALKDEASGPRGSFLPLPGGDNDSLKADVQNAKGRAVIVESTAGAFGSGNPAPKGDWEQRRFGFAAPDALLTAAEFGSNQILAAAGISPALYAARDAASSVAAYRHLVHGVVWPLARIVQRELSEKLGGAIKMDFSDLRAADVQARAGAFRRLVEGGMDTEKALALSGLLAVD